MNPLSPAARVLARGTALLVAAVGLAPLTALPARAADGTAPAAPQTSAAHTAVAPDVPEAALDLGPEDQARTYLVQLDKAAVPARGAGRSRAKTPSALTWRSTLGRDQSALRSAMSKKLGTTPAVGRSYTEAVNGFTVTLTGAQARQVAALPGVLAVTVDRLVQATSTSNGTDWIKADALWTGTGSEGVAARGDGIVIGVIDSGINPANPSFAATVSVANGGDGHVITNPRGAGKYLGMCDPTNKVHVANWGCNDKLIGAWNLTTLPMGSYTTSRSPYDDQGHGSHTAATAAGNQVRVTWPGFSILPSTSPADQTSSVSSILSGVAPHANLISYDACALNVPQNTGRTVCSSVDLVAAFEQAIKDDVDVINYSLGGSSPTQPWSDPVAQAQLNARSAGISVSVAAGNSGPNPATVTFSGDVPWVTSVANTSHDLTTSAGSVSFTSANGQATSVGPFSTATLSSSLSTPTAIVQARDVDTIAPGAANDGYCMPSTLPSAAVTGKVVLCDRGNNARINKGRVVKDAVGAAMILLNATEAQDQVRDLHVLPTAHVSKAQADALRSLLSSDPGTRATIVGGSLSSDPSRADMLHTSSSRGPTRNGTWGLGVSVSAPGTDVLAAAGVNNSASYDMMTGTSMAAPHVAGAMALLKQLHPAWTDAEISSALMTTADTSVRDFDGTPATWFEQGSGRVDLSRASRAGLLLDTPVADFTAADPAKGGDLRTVNSAQITDGSCAVVCTNTRTVKATATGLGTWTVTTSSNDAALTLAPDLSSFTMDQVGQSQGLSVTATVTTPPALGTWYTGTLTLTPPPGSGAPAVHLPVAVTTSTPTITASSAATHRQQGTHAVGTARLPFPADAATWTVSQPTAATVTTVDVAQDPTPTGGPTP